MLENLVLIALTIFILLFIALLWLRHSLNLALQNVEAQSHLLQKDFEKRRDTVPYLLESARQSEAPTDAWRKVLETRSGLHTQTDLQKELNFEKILMEYLQRTPLRSLNFLEAKKDIEDLSKLIEEQKKKRLESMEVFNQKRKEFPYSLASAIFGFRPIEQ